MKKFYFIMSIIFIIITFVLAFLVFTSSGELNAGYCVIPMLITLSFSSAYRKELTKEKSKMEKLPEENNQNKEDNN